MITQKELKELLHYDPDTGIFIWKKQISNRISINSIAGTLKKDSKYIIISIKSKSYRAHRLAFLYMIGSIPEYEVDHIDRNRSNNKWNNLRGTTRSQNGKNVSKQKNNTSKYKGVNFMSIGKKIKRWRSYITINNKQKHLGSFATELEAALAYNEAAIKYFGEYACLNILEKL